MGQNDYFISEIKLKWNISEDYFAEGFSTLLKLYSVSSSLTVHAYKPLLSVCGLVPNHLWPTENRSIFRSIEFSSIFWSHLNKFSQVLLGCQMQTTNATSHQVITTHNLMLTCFPPEYEMWPHWMTVHQELKTLDGFTQRRWEHRSLLASRQTVQTLFVITIQSQTLLVMFSLCLSSEYINKGLDIFCFWFVCKSIIYTS